LDTVWLKSETFEALVRINPLPHTQELVAQERYAEAFDYLSFFMDYDYVRSRPEALELYHEIEAKRQALRYRLEKVAEGIIRGTSDELEGQLSAVIADFFVIGDVRDLTLEGLKWMHDEDVDEFTAALSAIGIVASASSLVSAGSTLSAKPALSFLKTAKKVDKVPPWLQKKLIRSAKVMKHTKRLDDVADILDSTHTLFKTSGVRSTLVLLDKAEDTSSLKVFTKFGKTFGKKSATLLDITGDTGIAVFKNIDDVPQAVFLEAATYGKPGLRKLEQVGSDAFTRFLRHGKFFVRTTKVTYKHHEVLLNWSVQAIKRSFGLLPTWALWLIVGYGSLLLFRH
jgi:hypothetical protein